MSIEDKHCEIMQKIHNGLMYSGLDAIDIIYTVSVFAQKCYTKTRQIIEHMLSEHEIDIPANIYYPLRMILDNGELLSSIIRHINTDTNGIEHVFESIKLIKNNNIENIHEDEYNIDYSMNKLIDNKNLRFTIFRTKISPVDSKNSTSIIIPKKGDILIGFRANNDISFELKVHGQIICTYNLKKGDFVYSIENKYSLPLICSHSTNIYININEGSYADLELLYGLLQNNDRKILTEHKFQMSLSNALYLTYYSGYVNISQNEPLIHERFLHYPHMLMHTK